MHYYPPKINLLLFFRITALPHLIIAIAIIVFSIVQTALASEQSMTIQADQLATSEQDNIIKATGSVEINQGQETIYTHQAIYNRHQGTVTAPEPIQYFDQQRQHSLFAQQAEIQEDFSCGSFLQAETFFTDGSSIAAAEITKTNQITTAQAVKYYFCPSNNIFTIEQRPTGMPHKDPNNLLVATAKTATIDQNKNTITFHQAVIRVKNIPIFYWPKLRITIPDGQKHSGLASISYTSQGNLGGGIEIGYNWYINNHHLIKLIPIVYLNGAFLMQATYKHSQPSANPYYSDSFRIKLATGNDNNQLTAAENPGSSQVYTAYVQGVKFLNPDWSIDYSIGTFSNRRYRYNFEGNDDLTYQSYLSLKYTSPVQRHYLIAELVSDRDLTLNRQKVNEPLLLPLALHFEHSWWQGKQGNIAAATDLETTLLDRTHGVSFNYFAIKPTLYWQQRTSWGFWQTNLHAELQSITYKDLAAEPTYSQNYHPTLIDYSVQRQLLQGSLDWRLPQYYRFKHSSLLIEPRIKLVTTKPYNNELYTATAKEHRQYYYESGRPKELQINSLFSDRLFSGQEIVENGSRISYGLKLHWQGSQQGSLNFDLAQSYILNDPNALYQHYLLTSEDHPSHIIGKTTFNSEQGLFALYHQFTLDRYNVNLLANEIGGDFHLPKADLAIGTTTFHRDLLETPIIERYVRNTGYISIGLRPTPAFKLKATHTWNLENGDIEYRNLAIAYSNKCIELEISYVTDYVEEREKILGRSDTKEFNFNIIIKNSRF